MKAFFFHQVRDFYRAYALCFDAEDAVAVVQVKVHLRSWKMLHQESSDDPCLEFPLNIGLEYFNHT